MTRARPPLLMCLMAAAFATYLVFDLYVWIVGPEARIGVRWMGGETVVTGVGAGSAAATAGIQRGDKILAIDGHRLPTAFSWYAAWMNLKADRAVRFTIDRGGDRREALVTFAQRSPAYWLTGDGAVTLSLLAGKSVYVALAILLIFSRPREMVPRVAALLLGASAAVAIGPEGFAAYWREAPFLFHPLLWLYVLNYSLGFGWLLTFVTLFPRRLPRANLILPLAWAPILLIQPWSIRVFTISRIYRPEFGTEVPGWMAAVIPLYWLVYMPAAVTLAIVNYRGVRDVSERRRARLVVAGMVVAILANLPRILFVRFNLSSAVGSIVLSPAASITATLLSLALPISFAVAVLRERLFDVRVIIRQGLRYAVARGLLVSLVPALAIALATDLAMHADEKLTQILADRGWIYISIAAVASVAHVYRRRWLDAIDRRFFRERYDSGRLLHAVAEQVSRSRDLTHAAVHAVNQIETALHPVFAAVVVRGDREIDFHDVASTRPETRLRLRADSKLMALVRVLGQPLDTSRGGWMQQLSESELELVSSSDIELLVPIALSAEGPESLLLLGRKRSEEPYTAEDREVLQAIAASLGLVIAATPRETVGTDGFRECPSCGRCFGTNAGVCEHDGAPLMALPVSRFLGGRYRLDRRIGRGGMATVYEATDTVLERAVAAKLIRDDLLSDAVAAARFQREARLAAGLAHPNVVTVYDFGITGARAYLIMELLKGRGLREEIRSQGRIPLARTLEITSDICAGVEAAHEQSLVHRDLKPENIFVTAQRAKVLDFGISKLMPVAAASAGSTMTLDTRAGAVPGTLHYMAPEQLAGGTADTSWDIWALGVIVYEMLTGMHPFATGEMSVQGAIIAGKFAPVTVSYLSSRVNAFFELVFSADRERRPRTATQLLKTFRAALDQERGQ